MVKYRSGALSVLIATLTLAGSARADMLFGHAERPFPMPPPNAVPIRLEVGDKDEGAKLFIPKRLLAKAKGIDDRATKPRTAIWPSTLAVAVGLTLTLAVSGLGFLRLRNRPGGKGLVVVLALAAVLIAGRCPLQANAPPLPPRPPAWLSLEGGKVTVEVVDDGDAVRLVVPKAQVAEWAAKLKPPEKNAP